jgi:hypothetical protein
MSVTTRSKVKKVTKLLCVVVKDYFDVFFIANNGVCDPFLELIQSRVPLEDNEAITTPVTKEEIKKILFQINAS